MEFLSQVLLGVLKLKHFHWALVIYGLRELASQLATCDIARYDGHKH